MFKIFVTFDTYSITTTSTYDAFQRPLTLYAEAPAPLSLAQTTRYYLYGETTAPPEFNNLRGQLYQLYDEAGLTTNASFSITGSPLQSTRQLREDYTTEVAWPLDISDRNALLQTTVYTQTIEYDALARVTDETDPVGNQMFPTYYISGRLESIGMQPEGDTSPTPYLTSLTYTAKNQPIQKVVGNGVTTTYIYENTTERLRTIESLNDSSVILQSLQYQYDPVGNIVEKCDNNAPTQFYNNEEIDGTFTYQYDAVYQLIEATGRELMGLTFSSEYDYYKKQRSSLDTTALQNYIETYTYDNGGNMLTNSHTVDSTTTVKTFVVSNTSNRAVNADITVTPPTPSEVDAYFDACGNRMEFNTTQPLLWDYRNQLQQAVMVIHEDDKQDAEYYVYDSAGTRVRKVEQTYAGGGAVIHFSETVYLGSLEIRNQRQGTDYATATLTEEHHDKRVLAGDKSIATYQVWTTGTPP